MEGVAIDPRLFESARQAVEAAQGAGASINSVMELYRQSARELGERMAEINRALRELTTSSQVQQIIETFAHQGKAIQQASQHLTNVVEQVWTSDDLRCRLRVIDDALKNATAFQDLGETVLKVPHHGSRLAFDSIDVAASFSFDYSTFVSWLPPPLPADDELQEEEEHHRRRDEEIGAKLEEQLATTDIRFLQLRQRSWENLAKGDAASLRLAAHGIREVYDEVLRLLAPDEEVKQTDIWKQRRDKSLSRPSRAMRIEFIIGPAIEPRRGLVQFDSSLKAAQKFAHTFADDPDLVRVYMAQLENCIYLLLINAKPRK